MIQHFLFFQSFDDRKHPLWKLHGEVYGKNDKKDRSDLEKLENECISNIKPMGFGEAATLEMEVYSKMLQSPNAYSDLKGVLKFCDRFDMLDIIQIH